MDFTLGDWCKYLEKNFSPEIMIPKLPVIIRLDGNNFSSWTKGLEKPFDDKLHELMVETTKFLVDETNALMGYTQSDEITLLLFSDDVKKEIYHNGKKQKILSKLTSKCSVFFNDKRRELLPEHNKTAIFDARIYQVPTLQDAVAQFIWRGNDAVKNSISVTAQTLLNRDLHGVNTSEMQEMLWQDKGINWNDFEVWKKRGSYVRRVKTKRPYTKEEIDKLPLMHDARKNPDILIERNVIEEINIPILNKIESEERVKLFFG